MKIWVVAGMALPLWLSGAAFAEGTVNESRDVSPECAIHVENVAGSVRITGWDRAQVEVTGKLGQGTERLDVTGGGDQLRIEVVLPKGRNQNVRGSDLEIQVPRRARLSVNTVSASVDGSALGG